MLNRWDHVSKIRDHYSKANLKKQCSSTLTDALQHFAPLNLDRGTVGNEG